MRYVILIIGVLLVGSLGVTGCKNDEVEALEQEVLAQQGGTVQAETAEVSADTAAVTAVTQEAGEITESATDEPGAEAGEVPDPGAIPEGEGEPSPGAVPVEEETPVQMPPRPSGTGYEVQISSGIDREYAALVIEKFRERGYEPYATTTTVNGTEYYRVRLGMYATWGEAERIRKELADKYTVEAWVDVAR